MKNLTKILSGWRDAPYRLMALATVSTFALASEASAQTGGAAGGINGVTTNLNNTFGGITNLLLNGALLGGLGLSGAGLLKLKAASDDGGQRVKYSEGMWRLGVGGGLAALPFVAKSMQDTVSNGQSQNMGRQGGVTYTN